MSTLDGAAEDAWALMVRPKNPMPPAVALDYVLDHADGYERARHECADRLFVSASNWLSAAFTNRMVPLVAAGACRSVVAWLAVGNLYHAELALGLVAGEVEWWLRPGAGVRAFRLSALTRREYDGLLSARRWHAEAKRALALARQLDALRLAT